MGQWRQVQPLLGAWPYAPASLMSRSDSRSGVLHPALIPLKEWAAFTQWQVWWLIRDSLLCLRNTHYTLCEALMHTHMNYLNVYTALLQDEAYYYNSTSVHSSIQQPLLILNQSHGWGRGLTQQWVGDRKEYTLGHQSITGHTHSHLGALQSLHSTYCACFFGMWE